MEQGIEAGGGTARFDEAAVDDVLGVGAAGVRQFAAMLEAEGEHRGLLGPREVPRLWERHLLNSAAVAAFLPETGRVADVGSGAGLPGIVLALVRPDLHFVLVESMQRRCAWLEEVVDALGLDNVEVRRARAEELRGKLACDAVTARAVAPLERLAGWTLPLLVEGGVLLAMKGERAASEVDEARGALALWGGSEPEILRAPVMAGVEETRVVRVRRERVVEPPGSRRPKQDGRKRPARRRPAAS